MTFRKISAWMIACLVLTGSIVHADYKRLLREGATRADVQKLYRVYASQVLNETEDLDEVIARLTGGDDYQESLLLAFLSNGWPIRSLDLDTDLRPPAGVWAFSKEKFGGLVRQFPADCKDRHCCDIVDLDGFDIKSIIVGPYVTGRLFSQANLRGDSMMVRGSHRSIKSSTKSIRIRTAPRIDYVTLSEYDSDGTNASMRLHISGANIDAGAIIMVNGKDLAGCKLQTRLDNSAWLGLGTDVAKAGYNLDPTYFAFPIYHYDLLVASLDGVKCGQTIDINVRNPDGQVAAEPLLYLIPTPETLDSDGDGLLDAWETGEVEGLKLSQLGANPTRKDLYIEVDRMKVPGRVWSEFSESDYPRPGIFPEVQAEYRRAPILNPDGSSGIELHIDYGQDGFDPTGPSRGGTEIPWKRYIAFRDRDSKKLHVKDKSQYCNATAIRDDPKYFDVNRRKVFRYCIFADQQWKTRSTGAGNKSSIFFLSLGVCRMRAIDHNYQRGVFMHEFGHLLSLTHGGNQSESFNQKPNFNSLMNYLYVFDGRDIDGKVTGETQTGFRGDNVYAYSEGMRMDLNEAQLSEVLGVANHYPIDWNGNGKIELGTVSKSVLGNRSRSIMRDCADWARLQFPITP